MLTAAAQPGVSSSPHWFAGEAEANAGWGMWRAGRWEGPWGGWGQGWWGSPTPHPHPHSLVLPSAGIAVGFYGNGETSDGVHRATYSLRHANRTVAGVQDRVSGREIGVGCAGT